ncbi:hypothetical protein AOQ84DRAFT_7996 [Glonium stellatum]|uniref:Uncharacterized protein n=1 Tax=Glonium stellatum TaxID=574774 RepID=A0A8E2F3Y3_9PEZI|nr:hypothetical protein AOQ84DRAFT_7996 [Glonium stellatum]
MLCSFHSLVLFFRRRESKHAACGPSRDNEKSACFYPLLRASASLLVPRFPLLFLQHLCLFSIFSSHIHALDAATLSFTSPYSTLYLLHAPSSALIELSHRHMHGGRLRAHGVILLCIWWIGAFELFCDTRKGFESFCWSF